MFDEVEMFFIHYPQKSSLVRSECMVDYMDMIMSGACFSSNDTDYNTLYNLGELPRSAN